MPGKGGGASGSPGKSPAWRPFSWPFFSVSPCTRSFRATRASTSPFSARHGVANRAGLVGAYLGGLLAEAFGVWGYLVRAGSPGEGCDSWPRACGCRFGRGIGALFLALVLLAFLGSPGACFGLSVGTVRGRRRRGAVPVRFSQPHLSVFGAYFVLICALVAAVQLTFGLTWSNFWQPVTAWSTSSAGGCGTPSRPGASARPRPGPSAGKKTAGGGPVPLLGRRSLAGAGRAHAQTPARKAKTRGNPGGRAARRRTGGHAVTGHGRAAGEAVDRFLDAYRPAGPVRGGGTRAAGQARPAPAEPPAAPAASAPAKPAAPKPEQAPGPAGAPMRRADAVPGFVVRAAPSEARARGAGNLPPPGRGASSPASTTSASRARSCAWCPAPWSPCSRSSRRRACVK